VATRYTFRDQNEYYSYKRYNIVHVCKHKLITPNDMLSEIFQVEFQEHSVKDFDENTLFKISECVPFTAL